MTATSIRGSRSIAANDFFQGYLDTALTPDEILTAVTFPAWPDDAVGSVTEVARRHGDYALVGVVARLVVDGGGIITDAALAFFGASSTAVRVAVAEETLVDSPANEETFAAVATIVSSELEPPSDIHGSTAYRKHLAGTITLRGLRAAAERIGASA
jgi:carbon-monoxide dehydrogenase medium subunit